MDYQAPEVLEAIATFHTNVAIRRVDVRRPIQRFQFLPLVCGHRRWRPIIAEMILLSNGGCC